MPNRNLKDPGMLMKARSVLLAARDLLSDRSRWTQGTVARTGSEATVQPTHPLAQKWCAVGAIDREAHQLTIPVWEMEKVRTVACELMQQDLLRFEGHQSIPQVNDGHNAATAYKKIMGSLDRLLSPLYLERMTKRSEAAMKGWETRRRLKREHLERVAAEVTARRAAWEARRAASQTMTFGGTIAPSTNADAKKEITV